MIRKPVVHVIGPRRRGLYESLVAGLDDQAAVLPCMTPPQRGALRPGDQVVVDLAAPPLTARLFISLLSPDRAFTCVDGELPVSQDGQPVIAFGADTLFVLQQSAGQQSATTYLNAYTIDDSICAWLPIPGQRGQGRPATKGGARSG